jgi:hypothetical protein
MKKRHLCMFVPMVCTPCPLVHTCTICVCVSFSLPMPSHPAVITSRGFARADAKMLIGYSSGTLTINSQWKKAPRCNMANVCVKTTRPRQAIRVCIVYILVCLHVFHTVLVLCSKAFLLHFMHSTNCSRGACTESQSQQGLTHTWRETHKKETLAREWSKCHFWNTSTISRHY